MCAGVLSHFSCVQLCVTSLTVAHQAPLSIGVSRQEYLSGLSHPPQKDLPDPGIEPMSLTSPALAVGSLPLAPPGKPKIKGQECFTLLKKRNHIVSLIQESVSF